MSNLEAREVTIGTSATAIFPTDTTQTAGGLTQPVDVLIVNDSGNTVYLGGSGVTTAAGLPVADGESVRIALTNDILYGIAGTSSDIHILVN